MNKLTRIDHRFSAAEFERRGLDSEDARILAVLLASRIQEEMHTTIQSCMEAIIDKLNSMGHDLKSYARPSPGHIAYRDDSVENEVYKCKLRVALDMNISTGYAHLIILQDTYGMHDDCG